MENKPSKTELKRLAKQIEHLAAELVQLSAREINTLPCDSFLRKELLLVDGLKGGARKRQIKYIAKELRELETEPFFAFLEEKRGSKLKHNREFHEIERLRDAILNDAIEAIKKKQSQGEYYLDSDWESPSLLAASEAFPSLDIKAVHTSATRFAHTRKQTYSREIFRLLKGAQERLLFQNL
ncbi:ribosome biogenesis factor YjgA [Thermodesulfobacteriota bacterium]